MVIIHFLRLIRFPILVFVALIQAATRWLVIEPMIKINGYSLIMSDRDFWLLVLSSALIGGGGYAINDYFDVKIDRINKPKKIIVGRLIKRRVAMAAHVVMTAIGVILASWLSYHNGLWELSSLFVLAAFLLWYYSTNLQNTTLVGNIIIALIASFAPLIVGLYEIPLQNAAHPDDIKELGFSPFNGAAFWIMAYSGAFFLLTLAREITKDVIDIRGDKYYEARTVPIVLGVAKTKGIIMLTYALFGAYVSYWYYQILWVHSGLNLVFIVTCILLFAQVGLLFKARTKRHFLYSANLNVFLTTMIVLTMYLLQLSIATHFNI